MIHIYTIHSSNEAAEVVTTSLLEAKLVACANHFPIQSYYTWKTKLQCEDEVVVIYKSTKEKRPIVKKHIEEIHPYETPCIIKIKAEAATAFKTWIEDETS